MGQSLVAVDAEGQEERDQMMIMFEADEMESYPTVNVIAWWRRGRVMVVVVVNRGVDRPWIRQRRVNCRRWGVSSTRRAFL